MKKIFLIITGFLFSASLMAQVPQLFKYQGLARASDGNPVSTTTISLRISIHQGNPTGTVVYTETHSPLTNEFGSFSVNIGGGTVVTGNFSTIPWGRNTFFQEVEMDITGGSSYVSMGTSQYLSIPYALATDSAKSGIAPFIVKNTATGNDTSSVAIIAISNGTAPAIYGRNLGAGESLVIEGISLFAGEVFIEDTLHVEGIKVNGAALNGGFSNFQVFNASGTFTVPAGVTKVMVELWGAGGGGGGGGGEGGMPTPGGNGGGGGGGGYVKDILSVNPAELITVTIGSAGGGGNGGLSGSPNGQNGGTGGNGGSSSFGATTAGGGNGGGGGQGGTGTAGGNEGPGGTGGNAPGLFGIGGEFGLSGNDSGFGGSCPNGGFGANPGGNRTPGGGGSGGKAQNGNNGNNGTIGGNGRVLVWW